MTFDTTCNEIKEQEARRVVLVVPKQCVKTVKTALERHGKLDQTFKISSESDRHQAVVHINLKEEVRAGTKGQHVPDGSAPQAQPARMRIATTIPYEPSGKTTGAYHEALVLEITGDLGISHISNDISISHHTVSNNGPPTPPKNPLHKALHSALSSLSDTIFTSLNLIRSSLISSFPDGYSIYTPLLLLPHNALASPSWTSLLAAHSATSPTLEPLWSTFASAMNVTHIAINSPIPLTQSSLSSTDNILRSPLNIAPLFGDFGTTPTEENKENPSQEDFDSALWVSATQNGIHQVWAPLYTMFSRGNIREKTRVLQFPRPSPHAQEAVVDMYAGIGYFSFSYRAAGFRPIFCFELNPWSVEGLRRGAERNGWTYRIYSLTDLQSTSKSVDMALGEEGKEVHFYIFQTSNIHALPFLSPHLSTTIPPIRHVNLGLLPHSRDSWEDAVKLVDMNGGGWIHAHENVGVVEMDERTEEVERMFQGYLNAEGRGRKARVEHVERVKMYAPGVVHCVFDVRIEGVGEVGKK